jgi:hypothetical protein
MASAETRLREVDLALYREGEGKNGGRDGVFWLTMELGAVMVKAETHRPDPFIGGQGLRRRRDISSPAGGYFPPSARARAW